MNNRTDFTKNRNSILKMILAALFLALTYVLPFLTGQIPEVGSMLCPMHIPVLLCGFICGWQWGLAVGLTAPILRSLILTMPPIFPTAVCMAFELAAYGALAGLMHRLFPKKKPFIYCSLLAAMVTGRIVFGAAMLLCMSINGGGYTFSAFITGTVVEAFPGILLQLLLIPPYVMVLEDSKLLKSLS